MKACKLCGMKTNNNETYCEKCNATIFQINEIIEVYKNSFSVPNWLSEAIIEFQFIYKDNARVSNIFNSAAEVAEAFIINGNKYLVENSITSMNMSSRPTTEIISILQEGNIIYKRYGKLYPGEIIEKCIEISDQGYELSDTKSKKSRKEMFGFLGIVLTKTLLERGESEFVPRSALAVIHIISLKIIGENKTKKGISDHVYRVAVSKLPTHLKNKLLRKMSGFSSDCDTKIIRDIDYDGNPILKDSIIEYTDRMRERYRDRKRDQRYRII